MNTRVIINGAAGRMGQACVRAISDDPDLTVVGTLEKQDDLSQAIKQNQAEVVVDFTVAGVGFNNAKAILEAGAHPVIGTTGFTPSEIKTLQKISAEKQIGGIIAPNFSIGAVLMMKYARECAAYLPHVEIIELHHDQKRDAPSGTALKTAEMIAETRSVPQKTIIEQASIDGVRGGQYHDINIHSVRLPGLVAHQEVIFGGKGETLRFRHDTINREAFMPGVCLACKQVLTLKQLVYGLENIL